MVDTALSQRFSPRALASFVGLLERLEDLLLGGCIAWREPSYLEAHEFDIPTVTFRLHMPNLKRLTLFDDVFSCFRLLQFLEPAQGCVLKVHAAVTRSFAWDPDERLVQDALQTMLTLVDVPSIPVDTLSVVLGHVFAIRIETRGEVQFDVKLDLRMLESYRGVLNGATFDDLSAVYSNLLPPLFQGWLLENTAVLRFGVHMGAYEPSGSFDGMGLQAVGEALFPRCKSVTMLHIFGISFPLYQALAGCWYKAGTFKTVDALPALDSIVVVGSSFIDPTRREIAILYFQVLDRFLAARSAKHHDVHRVCNLTFVDFPLNRVSRRSIGYEQLRDTLLPNYVSDGGSILIQTYDNYRHEDSGWKAWVVCRYCSTFGTWYSPLARWWEVETCICNFN